MSETTTTGTALPDPAAMPTRDIAAEVQARAGERARRRVAWFTAHLTGATDGEDYLAWAAADGARLRALEAELARRAAPRG